MKKKEATMPEAPELMPEKGELAKRFGEVFTNPDGPFAAPREQERLPTLKEKLSKVAAYCAYVRKDGVNLFHKYNYATAATIFEKVNEALIEHRLISVPTFEIASDKELTNAKGNRENMVACRCVLSVFDLDSDAKPLSTVAFGSGQDNGDKAVMKAQTAALKYAWMMLLNISTGDDPEDDAKVDSRMSGEPITKKKTKEEYEATVEANRTAHYSPEAIRLSNEINASLKAQEEPTKGLWPGDEPQEEGLCKCKSPLIRKTTSKEKGSKPYLTCSLSDKAFRKDFEAEATMQDLAATGICGLKEHTWKWVK